MRLLQLIENLNRTGEGKSAVVGWGRGMGHKGHMYLASSVITQASDEGADPYFVVSRTVGKDDPITPEEKMQIYKKVFPQHGHIFHTATDEMPDLTRVLARLDRHGYTDVTVVVGADQVKGLSYVKQYNGVPDKAGNIPFSFNSLNVIARQETNDPSREEEGPRATPMRAVLMDPTKSEDEKFAVWRDAMNPEIDDDEVRDLMRKAQSRMQDFNKPKAKAKKEKAVAEGLKEANIIARSLREGSPGKGGTKPIDKEKKAAMRNASTLPDLNMSTGKGGAYMNYRMGIALAGAPNFPAGMEADNWIGGDPLLSTYTEEEFDMIKQAAKQVGAGTIQNWSGKRSQEVADVNKTSTVAKIKKNKYGV
jgi:hypothetical protein